MFTQKCNLCGHEWIAASAPEGPCPNCHSRPSVTVSAQAFSEFNKKVDCYSRCDLDPTFVPGNPIYEASLEERLNDVIRACEQAKSLINLNLLRDYKGNPEKLGQREFAIGNWIVRPRFP